MRVLLGALVAVLLVAGALGDSYLHNPRGSNNRLNERSANRRNGNRLFDSQNNNRGGYNVGDRTHEAFDGDDPLNGNGPTAADLSNYDVENIYQVGKDIDGASQYPLVHMEGSMLSVEWTAQHGCGGNEQDDPHKLNCNMMLQYMCNTADQASQYTTTGWTDVDPTLVVAMRDGGNTNTPTEPDADDVDQTATDNMDANRGRQESEAYYLDCKTRRRNKGLFTADQRLRGESSKYTRQNPHGTRRGLECPEERDHWPYWHPSPWKDVAVLSDDVERCERMAEESMNVAMKYKCVALAEADKYKTDCLKHNTMAGCEAQENDDEEKECKWSGFTHNLPKPDCQQSPWSRVNHLGNGRNGQPNTYNWTLPTITQLKASGVKTYTEGGTAGVEFAACTFRLRYNISTDDYDPWMTDSTSNQNRNAGVLSPVQQNPTVATGSGAGGLQGLRLAINTAQFGRTFQDRSHVFFIKERPASVPVANTKVWNLNVRGKRGNIVQTFPAVEYDWQPNQLVVKAGDVLHVQWTGSNTHNNGNPAGDGQAGDAGEGRGGTDRHNLVAMMDAGANFPTPLDTGNASITATLLWSVVDCLDPWTGAAIDQTVCQLALTTSGHLPAKSSISTVAEAAMNAYGATASNRNAFVGPLLDDSPASLSRGILLKVRTGVTCPASQKTASGDCVFHYTNTRNNNFSNRSQKGKIVVSPAAIEVNEIDANGGQIEMVFARLMVPAGVVPLGQLETVSIMAMPPMDGQRSGASEMIVVSGLTMEEGSEGAWLTIPFESKAMYSPSVSMSKDKGETWTTVGSTSFSGSEAKVNIRESGTYQVNNSLNVGIIIGIVLGGLAFLAIIFGLVYYKKNNNTCPVWRKMRGGASEPKFQRSHTEKKKTTKKPKKKSIKKPLNTFEPVEFPSAEESPIPVGNMAGKRAMFEQLDRDAQQV